MTDQQIKQILMIYGIVFGIALLAFPFLLKKNKLKESGRLDEHKMQKAHNKFLKYRDNVFVRKRFRLIEKQYATLACYDRATVEMLSVKVFENACLFSMGVPILIGILMRDILMFLLSTLVGYIYYDIAINKEYDRINKQVHEELTICIQSMRDKYMECGNIPKAVIECDKCTLLERPLNEIQEILTDANGEDRLYKFCQVSPIRLIKTLAMTCYIVNETGDAVTQEGGSAFGEDLISLRQEADAAVRHLEAIRIAFKSLPMIALIGIFIMPVEEWYLLSQIPGTSTLIKGTYGVVLKIIIVLMTAIAYYVISVMMRPSVVNQSDRGQFIDGLLLNKKFKEFIKDIIPKQQIKLDRIQNLIDQSLSQKDVFFVYASKVVFSCMAFVAGLVFAVLFIITTRSYMLNNYKALDFTASAEMKEAQFLQLVAMDDEYMHYKEPLEDEQALAFVKGRISGLNNLEQMQQRDRLQKKYKIVHSMVWKWGWGFLPILSFIAAWWIPNFALILRKKMVQYEATEDIMQLQTMMIVLSATDMDVFKAIYWLEKQASVHKEALRYCYHEYTSDPILALDHLGECSSSVEFHKIVNKLKSASTTLSLEEAFSDMKLDKTQFMYLRDMRQTEELESKKQNAKLLCVVPGGLALIGLFVAPILVLGITQLSSSLGNLGNI